MTGRQGNVWTAVAWPAAMARMIARRRMGRSVLGTAVVVTAVLAASSCTLEEVTIVDVEDVVVAEVLVQIERSPFEGRTNRITAFLHRTVGGAGAGYHEVPGAQVVVRRDDGFSVELAEGDLGQCVATTPVGGLGTCYISHSAAAERFAPGDALSLTITLPDGGVLQGATRIPGDFALENVADGAVCAQPAETPLELRWSASQDAWAYVNETSIQGLGPIMAAVGVEVDDPLYLLGLSVSAADTTIVFPGEFGLFNRFELDRTLAVTLQEGLPPGTSGDVTITAVDRNYVNWERGGNFNPSGLVRVPSLRGAGTGVFSAVVVRRFAVASAAQGGDVLPAVPACLP